MRSWREHGRGSKGRGQGHIDRALVIATCAALAACGCHSSGSTGAEKPATPTATQAPTATPAPAAKPAPTAPTPAPAPTADSVSEHLRELAARRALDRVPLERTRLAEERDILALGPCERPTPEERAALKQALLASEPALVAAIASSRASAVNADDDFVQLQLALGCKDKNGIVIDLAYDRDRQRGTWKVLRASEPTAAASFTTLAKLDGEARISWMEYAQAITLRTFALVDLDGDGVRDVVLERNQHEIGLFDYQVTLSLWASKRAKLVPLGKLLNYVQLDGDWAPGQPLVLRTYRSRGAAPPSYRCLLPAGKLGRCKQIEASLRADHAMAVLLLEQSDEAQPPAATAALAAEASALDVLDPIQLAKLLRELRASPAETEALLAEAAAARAARP